MKKNQNKDKEEIAKIIKNLNKWNDKTFYYLHPCTFEEDLKTHKIKIKILLAPLAFH